MSGPPPPVAASHVAGRAGERLAHGLVIGTFYPPHVGHLALVRAALSRCDRVTVEVLGGSTESIPVSLREEWLREEAPTARVVGTVDDADIDFESVAAWDHHTGVIRSLLDPADGPVAAVFTSDAYGEELARRLDAQWVRVDPERSSLTVSSTAVRADVPGQWWALPAPVRAHLAKRVVVVGAGPTGTTALARGLAAHFGVPCVPGVGPEWAQARPGGVGSPWAGAELSLLAREQGRREDDAARRTPRPLLVCDTDVLTTAPGPERHLGPRTPGAATRPPGRVPDLYLLAVDDVPVGQDGWWDDEHPGRWTTGTLRAVLAGGPAPWVEVSGSPQERLARSVEAVEAELAHGWGLAPSLEQQQQQSARLASGTGPGHGAGWGS